jgi:hypothetical protein
MESNLVRAFFIPQKYKLVAWVVYFLGRRNHAKEDGEPYGNVEKQAAQGLDVVTRCKSEY